LAKVRLLDARACARLHAMTW